MKKNTIWKKRATVLGCILVGAGVLVSGISFAGMGFSMRAFVSPRGEVAQPETFSFTGDEIREVDVESGFRNVRVEGVPGLKAPELVASPDLFEYELGAGPKLTVRETEQAGRGGWKWFQLFTFNTEQNSEVVIRLPEDLAVSLRVKSSFGSVRVKDLSQLEDLFVESQNEAVRLSALKVVGKAELSSSFGNITMQDSRAEELTVRDSNGDVTLEGCSAGGAVFTTEFGNLRVRDSGFDALMLDNSNGHSRLGSVKVKTHLQHHSSFGDLSFDGLECPSLDLRAENGNISGTIIGSESDYKISANVKYGDTNLQGRLEGKNQLQVESQFGDVNIHFAEN